MIVLILAGGGGTRLWPLSRDDYPKQFLNFGNHPSLLQKTILRFIKSPSIHKILISTNDQYRNLIEEQIRFIDPENICKIISEPMRKNTAPALAYSFRYLEEIYQASPKESVLVIPSDHFIEPESTFLSYLDQVQEQAKSKIIVFGITATKPETGYGYIEKAYQLDSWTYKIEKFIEKPNLEQAEKYVASGLHYWNCGIFLFSIELFWNQLKMHAPEIYEIAQKNVKEVRENYELFPNISIDYAMMEKTKEALLCPMTLNWSDVGSWDSLYEVLEKDQNQNVLTGNVETLETRNSLIIAAGKRIISAIGLDNLLIIDTGDALLISRKGESQKVKNLIQKFKK